MMASADCFTDKLESFVIPCCTVQCSTRDVPVFHRIPYLLKPFRDTLHLHSQIYAHIHCEQWTFQFYPFYEFYLTKTRKHCTWHINKIRMIYYINWTICQSHVGYCVSERVCHATELPRTTSLNKLHRVCDVNNINHIYVNNMHSRDTTHR